MTFGHKELHTALSSKLKTEKKLKPGSEPLFAEVKFTSLWRRLPFLMLYENSKGLMRYQKLRHFIHIQSSCFVQVLPIAPALGSGCHAG